MDVSSSIGKEVNVQRQYHYTYDISGRMDVAIY